MENLIERAIQREPLLKGSPIIVKVKPGEIVLSGCVDNYAKKAIVKKTVKQMELHMGIIDNIQVSRVGLPTDDEKILEEIHTALQKNLGDTSATAIATSKAGFVELSGFVKWSYQTELAAECISEINGIREIINNIIAVTVSEEIILKRSIIKALKLVFNDDITVDVQGNDVILEGRVKSTAYINDMEQLVKSIPGVINVKNYLMVG